MTESPPPLALHQARALAEGLHRLCAHPAAQGLAPHLHELTHQAQSLAALLSNTDPPAPAAGDLDALDQSVLEGLLTLAGADMATLLIKQIRIDLSEAGEGLAEGLARLDWEQIRRHSHVLVSVAGSIGAEALQHRAEAINSAAHSTTPELVETLIDGVLPAITRINARLAALLPPAATAADLPGGA